MKFFTFCDITSRFFCLQANHWVALKDLLCEYAFARSFDILVATSVHSLSRSMLDSEGNVPLHSAVHAGDIAAVKLCLDNGALISTQQHDLSTPAHLACAQGATEIVKLMFESQPHEQHKCMNSKDAQDMTPIVSSSVTKK